MGNFEKFLFDTSFDAERTAKAKAAAAAQTVAEEPPAPTFSEAELAAAQQAAFADGKAAGTAEAEGCHAARLAAALEALPPQLAQIAEDVAAAAAERRRDSLEAALVVVRKLFPQLAREHGLEEAHAVIQQCLERLRDEPRVVIRCADADLDALRARAEDGAARSGFEGKLVFLADERLASGDLRVEWADGGAERQQAALWQEIDAVIARALAPAGEPRQGASPAGSPAKSPAPGDKKQTQQPAAPQGAASPSPRPDKPAAVQPLRRAQSA
jgi:flagellar assembly protein FliH